MSNLSDLNDSTLLQQIRREMPATTAHAYLNTGTFGPMPSIVIKTMEAYLQQDWREGRLGEESFQRMGDTYANARKAVARLLHANEGETALTDNTGEGLNIIINGFNWASGDEVITTNHEHFSALAPLYQIRNRYGVVIRTADLGPKGDRNAAQAIAELITSRTRLIVLSHVSWMSGAVLDVGEVAAMAHARDIPVLVDGAQSAGAIPIDVKALGVDFYAIPMQKWLCGPDGTGGLYTHSDSLNRVTCTYVGYFSAKHEENVEWELADTAQRFELGGRQTAAVAGQAAVLNWMAQTIGMDWIYKRISYLNAYACNELQTIPAVSLLTPEPGASGLVAFLLDGHDDAEVVKQLAQQHNIYIRNLHSTHALRVSTGFYNTEEDIDRLVQALKEM
ncbi:MAG TPA: aminotransferase class V-fold PLP-dependent enzyme [Ktedonobacteraceae bacterium]|nr:aminotransferase class V-fold PLP-dependent enzyme [Ktedonobacteraceae bacterium]